MTPDVSMKITVDGDDLIIDVTAPVDATTPVLVDVNGKGYYVNITDGKGQLVLEDLAGGNYDITARYVGDDKYGPSSNVSKSAKISDVPSSVSVKVDNITYGDKAIIEVSVPDDATGNVTVTIDGKPYTANVSGGKAIVIVLALQPETTLLMYPTMVTANTLQAVIPPNLKWLKSVSHLMTLGLLIKATALL